MEARIETELHIQPHQTETYVLFRDAVPKPLDEEAHLRHILRFYMTRALLKNSDTVSILPKVLLEGESFRVDAAAEKPDLITLTICEPESVTGETEEILEKLRDVSNVEVIVVHSQYASPGEVLERFPEQLESGKFKLLAVVPPPFDDVYEYDIWMFETTFRNLMEGY